MAISVKSMIVNNGRLLILKRASNDVQKPGIWEIPGGRIESGEDLIKALKRETKEETGLDIEVNKQISVRYFMRDDLQEIEMHIFLCNTINNEIILSKEHSEFLWIDIKECKEKLTEFFHPEIDILNSLDDEKWP